MSAEIIHGDCLEVMRGMADASVDAIVTDPPYFRVKGEEWDRQWDNADAFLAWVGGLCVEWRRILRPNGSLFVFTSPAMNARVEMVVREQFNVLNNIRWLKEAGWHKKAEKESLRSFLSPWEGIVFAEQRGDQYAEAAQALHKQVYAPIGRSVAERRTAAGLARWQVDEACAPSRKPTGLCYRWEAGDCLPTLEQFAALCRLCGDAREYEELRREYEELRRPFSLTAQVEWSDTWRFPPVLPYPGKHPCEKPQALLSHIISSATREGATVLDCFAGTGAVGIAATTEGRRFIGIEREAAYVEIARKRIADAQAQLGLGVA